MELFSNAIAHISAASASTCSLPCLLLHNQASAALPCLRIASSHATPCPLGSVHFSQLVRLPSLQTGAQGRHGCLAVSGEGNSGANEHYDPARMEPREVDLEDENLTKHDRIVRAAERRRRKQQNESNGKESLFIKAIEFEDVEAEDDGIENPPDDGEFSKDVPATLANKLRKAKASGTLEATGLSSSPKETDIPAKTLKPPNNVSALHKNGKDKKQAREDDDNEDELGEEETVKEAANGKVSGSVTRGDDATNEDADVDASFDVDFARLEKEVVQVEEPSFSITLSELLDEARVTPLSVEGDLDVLISGIQHDSRQVEAGDMFVCCTGFSTDGHQFAAEAAEKGAVVIVASKEVYIGENVKAVVLVEDTNSILSSLGGAFYGRPSQKLAVVGITGTNGKTTTSYLLKSMYDSMGIKTGLIGTIAYYVFGKQKLEAPHTTPDAVHLQKLMATMVHNGTEVCVMEVSSHALTLDRCKEVDFDVAVFTNLTRDHMDFHKTEEEYREAKGKLFAKMVDPQRHRKVVNIDDPNAGYFVSRGNPAVPVVTFGMRNPEADVYPLDVQLSLFETELLVRTPHGNIEISSGLLGRHNVYNILAAVAVGIAVEAPLEDIVRGVEEVDAVPGRVELIDEEQTFAVIVDYAHTPDALARLLDTVRECGARRIITVIGCGGDRDRGKRPMMAKIATEKSEVSIFTSDNPRTEDPMEILDDMLAGVGWSLEEYLSHGEKKHYPPLRNGHRIFVHDLRRIAVRAAVAMGEEGDAVVVAGKGHEKYQIVGTEKRYYDDREECREALMHVDSVHAAGIDTSEFPWRFPRYSLS
ncbi:hypothetical protein O6H91_05G042600 [Diphasiastrum complanatum]|uniref:Uncharacterized protein n=1 Tax=Diphasiastrum complanatum TaxID=34168 RepID=A0ACC2DN24_DIPCM|nr:hypothetical protein O6H91_05G042600 [Diphasiastrum complanatum]